MKLQIGVKVLIRNSDGLFLFIQKTELLQNETRKSWDIPGGRIEPDENLTVALQREVKEELAVELTEKTALINAQDIFVTAKELHVVRLTYIVDQDIAALTLSEEHQAYRWCTIEDIIQQNVDPYLKETLELLT